VGNPLFGVNISGLIKQFVGPGVLDAAVTKSAAVGRTAGQLAGGVNPTTSTYACKGFVDSQARRDMNGTLISDGKVTIVLIGDTVAEEVSAGDTIEIEGSSYMIELLDRDPAGAVYTCVCTKT
jgi:hypothetical protein